MADSRKRWPPIPIAAGSYDHPEPGPPSWDRSAPSNAPPVRDTAGSSRAAESRRPPSRGRNRSIYDRVRRLLESKGAAARTTGSELLAWLRAQDRAVADAVSRELGDAVSRDVDDEMRAVAIEILARVSPGLACRHLATGIAKRPITAYHRYLIAFARIEGVADESVRNKIVDLLDQLPGALRHEDAAETAVEAFLSLLKLDPDGLIENALAPLRTFGGFEQTRLLDALAKAMRSSDVKPSRGLRELVLTRWRLAVSPEGERLADRAGIGARLLEILGRSGDDLEDLMQCMSGDEALECRILYQLVQQSLDFVSPEHGDRLVRRTIKLLAATGQTRTLFRLLGTLKASTVPKEVTAVLANTL
jgi:hypothetical protein